MLIDCPDCGKSYHIITAALGPMGRRVACPRCDAIWFVAPDRSAAASCAEDLAPAAATSLAGAGCKADFAELGFVLPAAAFSQSHITPARPMPGAPARRQPLVANEIFAAVALIALAMALIGFRTGMVRLWPRAENAYAALGLPVNLRGLAFENFHTITANDGFQTVLGIEGEIANLRPHMTRIPPIRLAIRDSFGRVLYSWTVTAQKQRLAANESLAFRAQLAAPPAAGRDIFVSFSAPSPTFAASLWKALWNL